MSKYMMGNQMASSTFDSNQFKMDQREVGIALLKDGKSGGSLLRKELKSSASD